MKQRNAEINSSLLLYSYLNMILRNEKKWFSEIGTEFRLLQRFVFKTWQIIVLINKKIS